MAEVEDHVSSAAPAAAASSAPAAAHDQQPQAGGTFGGLQFGERWDPQADIASNVRRSQIIALASSRAEKGSQDELLADRRSSIAKLDKERQYSASRDPTDMRERIESLAHSRAEAGHHQAELQPHGDSSMARLERERQHSEAHAGDDVDARIRALASSRSEKGSQGALTPDRRSSMALVEENRKHSMSYPAEAPRKSSVSPFVIEERRQEARKASIGGLEVKEQIDTSPQENARRASVADGLAAYASGTGQGTYA